MTRLFIPNIYRKVIVYSYFQKREVNYFSSRSPSHEKEQLQFTFAFKSSRQSWTQEKSTVGAYMYVSAAP